MTLKKMRPQRKRKAIKHREERFQATGPDQAWSIDFVADQLQDGRRFRALTVVDIFTREGVAIEVGQSLKGDDVVRTLNRSKSKRGVPKLLFLRQRQRVHKSSNGSVGLSEWSKDRLLTAGQAYRQRVLSSHSTGLSALSAWMPTGSTISMKQRRSSKTGGRNTMRVVLTDLSEKGHQASSPVKSRRAAI